MLRPWHFARQRGTHRDYRAHTRQISGHFQAASSPPWASPPVSRRFGVDNRNTDHQPHGVACFTGDMRHTFGSCGRQITGTPAQAWDSIPIGHAESSFGSHDCFRHAKVRWWSCATAQWARRKQPSENPDMRHTFGLIGGIWWARGQPMGTPAARFSPKTGFDTGWEGG